MLISSQQMIVWNTPIAGFVRLTEVNPVPPTLNPKWANYDTQTAVLTWDQVCRQKRQGRRGVPSRTGALCSTPAGQNESCLLGWHHSGTPAMWLVAGSDSASQNWAGKHPVTHQTDDYCSDHLRRWLAQSAWGNPILLFSGKTNIVYPKQRTWHGLT